jgi:glycosyltransferase involved in cell wall biosynthesis
VRVLHLVKGLGPGGAERLLVSLTEVASPDLDVHVGYVLPWKDHLVPELEAAGGTAHLLGGRRGLADVRWVWRLRRLVQRIEPDVVHLHSPAVAAVARPVLRLRPNRPALVSTEHNLWESFGRLTRVLNGLTLPLDDVRLAVSDEVRESAWPRPRARTEVLVHGVPVRRLQARRAERAKARVVLGVSDDDVLVVTIANFREKKDYPTLLAAAAKARREEPRLTFVSIGQGPLEAELQAMHVRLGLGGGFRFLGYHSDPAHVLAGADIFTLTSRHEGLPISLLEAIALGLPVVVSAVGGIPHVVRNDVEARLVSAGDVEGFAAAYVALARDASKRAALGRAAADRAKGFDIGQAARTLIEIYERAARHR